jgi:hypothetical protein
MAEIDQPSCPIGLGLSLKPLLDLAFESVSVLCNRNSKLTPTQAHSTGDDRPLDQKGPAAQRAPLAAPLALCLLLFRAGLPPAIST